MVSNSLPSILQPTPPTSPISMERALKQILTLLNELPDGDHRVDASIDDVDVMLSCIDRS